MNIKNNSWSHRGRHLLGGLVLALTVPSLPAQTAALTNYKTGISTTFSGTSGVDYEEEYFYSDKLVTDRKVVYIKSGTTITLAHNSRNISYIGSGAYGAVTGSNVGVITYKIDRDMQWGPSWGDGGSPSLFYNFDGTQTSVPQFNNPSYSTPFTLASLTYDGITPVVGTTGPIPSVLEQNYSNYYWRGILDSFGDEWHVLTIADNDTSFETDPEGGSSDGKIILFVVNPKTPCLQITCNGNAQFYTTPPKIYFVPAIHNQTTYFSAGTGTINFSLQDINGNNVFYRINGGAWSSGAPNPVLTAVNFNPGTNTLDYYYAGNAAFTKTRIIVKDPSYPSASEAHGNALWVNAAGFSTVVSRLSLPSFQSTFSQLLGDQSLNPISNFDSVFAQGLRITYGSYALTNAFVAAVNGWTTVPTGKTKSYALYAKQMLLESERTIDPVGSEISHSNRSLPARELYYRGYYDMNPTFSLAFAYDLLIANFKSTQLTGGITAVEDYFIRDQLAGCAFDAMMQEGHWQLRDFPNPGMWGTARDIGGLLVAMIMPTYSTPYYGTSGFDGNTTVYPYTPFPDSPLTWKKVFLDNNAPLVGYPNLELRFGIDDYEISSTGQFLDRVPYFDYALMGHCLAAAANMVKLYYPSTTYPYLEAAWINAVSGTLTGTQPSDGAGRFSEITILNQRFPAAAAIGAPWSRSLTPGTSEAEAFSIYLAGVYGLVWYENPILPNSPQISISVH